MNLSPCPFCQGSVRATRVYDGSRLPFFVVCTNASCLARWPREQRRWQAIENFMLLAVPSDGGGEVTGHLQRV